MLYEPQSEVSSRASPEGWVDFTITAIAQKWVDGSVPNYGVRVQPKDEARRDPSLGILHTDKRYRGSLAADLMEAGRPAADELVLELLGDRELRRGDVYETREGVCRLGPELVRELARSGRSRGTRSCRRRLSS